MNASELPRDDLAASLAARRELGPDYDAAFVEAVADRLERASATRRPVVAEIEKGERAMALTVALEQPHPVAEADARHHTGRERLKKRLAPAGTGRFRFDRRGRRRPVAGRHRRRIVRGAPHQIRHRHPGQGSREARG